MADEALDDITADLKAAWDNSESTEETPEEDVSHETSEETIDESGGWEGDAPNEEPLTAAEAGEEAGGDTGGGAEDFAPKSLSATAREAWRDTPQAMRDEITKREADFQRGIQKYAENANRAEAMDNVLAPYQQLFAMNGGAQETLPGLLQTASVLQMGSQPQKAQMLANLIQQFGVDIPTLDGVLSGQGVPQEMQQQDAVQQAVQQAIAPYQQQLQQQRVQQEQAVQYQQQEIQSDIQRFASDPKNEFYNDVRSSMADIMDLAANQGREMTLGQAYQTACQLNPEIAKIQAARQSARAAQQARRAGSSISGTPGGQGDVMAPDSMRGAIEDAWDNAGRT